MEQESLFDVSEVLETSNNLSVVEAKFISENKTSYTNLFDGFNELYAITFSYGREFLANVLERFDKSEIIFGCEKLVSFDIATIMTMQEEIIKELIKSKAGNKLFNLVNEKKLELFVSKDTRSHEKIYILKANDGRTRVITGSANFSSNAFNGVQRENVVYFDDYDAYDFYFNLYENYKNKCSNSLDDTLIARYIEGDENSILDNLPITNEAKKTSYILIEDKFINEDTIAYEISKNTNDLKKITPNEKERKQVIELEDIKKIVSKKRTIIEKTIEKNKKFPILHLDYDNKLLSFNNKKIETTDDGIISDINAFTDYMNSLSKFSGDVDRNRKEYYSFMVWALASPFMPYLRMIGSYTSDESTAFPVFGFLYGQSNGSKTTFVKLIRKMMCGTNVLSNGSDDFTYSDIEKFKVNGEGLPIYIDDLAKQQYTNNYEKVIKNDTWGLADKLINYPSVIVTTNKVNSFTPDISKRIVSSYIDIAIDKSEGMKNSKRINLLIKQMSNAFYSEYSRIMFDKVSYISEKMKEGDLEYYPDIFKASSETIVEIYSKYLGTIPEYMSILEYTDYYGDKVIGRNAIRKMNDAWNANKKSFEIDKKKNKLIYAVPDNSSYELSYIVNELPASLNAKKTGQSLIMDLDKAKQFFNNDFKKGWLLN